MMQDQAILRFQMPAGPAIPVHAARLLTREPAKQVVDFTALDDYTVYLELDVVASGDYLLAVDIEGYPTLHFSVRIEGAADRTFGFAAPAPACATISIQQGSAGPAVSRRIHVVSFSLPPKHEAVVLIAGADLKGGTRYVEFADTWRDDLYYGRTDLGGTPSEKIARGIHDHTVISVFDFRTGFLEQQIKGVDGWHSMVRVMQGNVPPDIAHPKADDALDRRQQADSISILDVYRHMSELGRAARGCVRELHFFSHAYLRGPVLLNTSDNSGDAARDPTDKDPRPKDFLPVNLANYRSLPDAFDSSTRVKNWGCFGSDMADKLRAVARTTTRDETVDFEGEPYSSADVIRELEMYTFPESYMLAFCRELLIDGWSLPPGTSSIYQTSPKRHYFVMHSKHEAVLRWWERNFSCKRELGGAIPYRALL